MRSATIDDQQVKMIDTLRRLHRTNGAKSWFTISDTAHEYTTGYEQAKTILFALAANGFLNFRHEVGKNVTLYVQLRPEYRR